jgi:hypothetical protein
MVVNDNAGWQVPRGVLRFIASKLAPTRGASAPALKTKNPMSDHGVFCGLHITHVGAGLLAMVVNDNAGWQVPRGVLRFIASKLAPTVELAE